MATSSGRGSITKGAIDQATGATATVRQGTQGSFLTIDATSLTGKGFQVPAASLTVQTDPNAASKQYFAQQQMQQQYQMSSMMVGMAGQALGALGPALAGLFGGGGGGDGESTAQASSKGKRGRDDGESGGGCPGGNCPNNRQASNDTWKKSCRDGSCENS